MSTIMESIVVEVSNCSYLFAKYIDFDTYVMISFGLLVGFMWIYFKVLNKTPLSMFALIFIILGGVANLLQRVSTGCVIDNINFFNVFYINIFDVCITFGTALMLLHVLKEDL